MRLSKRGEYGLRAMITLADYAENNAAHYAIPASEIAKRERISSKYLEQILLALKNGGFVHSRLGAGGGYYLAKSAKEITVGQIFRLLDGAVAPIRCVSELSYEPCGCPDAASCRLRLVMFDVRNAIENVLDQTSLADVLHRQCSIRLGQ